MELDAQLFQFINNQIKYCRHLQYIISIPFGLVFTLCAVMLVRSPSKIGAFTLLEITFFLLCNIIDMILLYSKLHSKLIIKLVSNLVRRDT